MPSREQIFARQLFKSLHEGHDLRSVFDGFQERLSGENPSGRQFHSSRFENLLKIY